jgi:glutathione S-transferase
MNEDLRRTVKKNSKPLLYQFALSHYCEKARWALDYKEIDYEIKNLIPGPHLFHTKRLAANTSVPIFVEAGKAIQDSTEIITYLDQKYPQKPLTPPSAELKKEAMELEEYFDEEVGLHLRRLFYFYVLEDRRLATSLLLQAGPRYGRPLYFFGFPLLKALMKKGMRIHAGSARRSEERLRTALKNLDQRISKNKFLVGDQFTRADLSAAALLASLCRPPQHDFSWPSVESMPRELRDFRREMEGAPFFNWVLGIYNEFRR